MENQEIRTIVLHLNDEEVKQKTENLKTRLREAARLKEALEKTAADRNLTKREANDLRNYTKEVTECNKSLSRLKNTKESVEKVLNSLSSAAPRELRKTLRSLTDELNSGKIERGSKEWETYQKAIRSVKGELETIKKRTERDFRVSKQTPGMGEKMGRFGSYCQNSLRHILGALLPRYAIRGCLCADGRGGSTSHQIHGPRTQRSGKSEREFQEDGNAHPTRTAQRTGSRRGTLGHTVEKRRARLRGRGRPAQRGTG